MSLSRRFATSGAKTALSPALRQAAIEDAAATLQRATAFLGSSAGIMAGEHGMRVTGNALREIDCFFGLLLDAIGGADMRRQHNIANKLGRVMATFGVEEGNYAHHLRSVGRVRDCLAYTNGTVRRGDSRRAPLLTMSWLRAAPDPAGLTRERVVRIGQPLGLTARDLSEICWFYDHIAADLLERTSACAAPPGR